MLMSMGKSLGWETCTEKTRYVDCDRIPWDQTKKLWVWTFMQMGGQTCN